MLERHADDRRTTRFLRRIYPATAIERRHTVVGDYFVPPEQRVLYPKDGSFAPEPTTSSRNRIFAEESDRLSLEVSARLLDRMPSFDRGRITHLITVSCTGFAAPGFDFHLMRDLGLSPDTHRFHLGFMGCFAAFPAMKLAQSICRADPDARVLICIVELCSLHFQQKTDLDTLVANALFSDGVSAALVSACAEDSADTRLRLDRFLTRTIENSEGDMAWIIGETGFDMKLSAYVPQLIQENVASLVDDLLSRARKRRSEIDIWAFHPGGRAILDRASETLQIPKKELQVSYEVLRDYGNMSSATIMFVLERILRDSRYGTVFAAAFGPGLTVESGLLEKVGA
jgi:predicted naringenin-chalcone synthase